MEFLFDVLPGTFPDPLPLELALGTDGVAGDVSSEALEPCPIRAASKDAAAAAFVAEMLSLAELVDLLALFGIIARGMAGTMERELSEGVLV